MAILDGAGVLETWIEQARGYKQDDWHQAVEGDHTALLSADGEKYCEISAVIGWLSTNKQSLHFTPREMLRLSQLVVADFGKCHVVVDVMLS